MKRIVILDGLRGIYIPQTFFAQHDDSQIIMQDKTHLAEIRKDCADPENELYWDSWIDFVDNAYVMYGEKVYALEEDGDLFGIEVPADRLFTDVDGNIIVLL